MDLWSVASCIEKYRQRTSREKEGVGEVVLGDLLNVKSESNRSSKCPSDLDRLDIREVKKEDLLSRVEREKVSSSGFTDGMPGCQAGFDEYNVLSLGRMPLGYMNEVKMNGSQRRVVENGGGCGEGLADSPRVNYGSGRRVNSLRSKHSGRYTVEPRSSLESCLIAQLYEQNDKLEEFVFGSGVLPRQQAVRSLVVTNGSRIISRGNSDLCGVQFENGRSKWCKENGSSLEENGKVLGVPSLQIPEIGEMKFRKKIKEKRGKMDHGKLSKSRTRVLDKKFQPQGSHGGMFLFYLGITFGVISAVIVNKREVEKVSELLKQSVNLVQDLQEELEMKDALTVKELANEDCEVSEKNVPVLYNQNADEKPVSMTEIEAELEAELEQLELNMKSTCSQRRVSGIEEDADFIAKVVQGELRADMMKERADSDKNTNGASTTETPNANYSVSPRELSLRLHEVLQLQLENRIMELENALENTQKKASLPESKQTSSPRDFLDSKTGCSSQGSSTMVEVEENSNITQQPLFLNLSGDALDAYDEAYGEFMKVTRNNDFQLNRSSPQLNSRSLVDEKIRTWEDSISRRGDSEEVCENEDGRVDDNDDLIEKLLIKQIVEKARQGSPVVLNAQRRLLMSLDKL